MFNEEILSERFLKVMDSVPENHRSCVLEIIITQSFGIDGACLTRTIDLIKNAMGVGEWVSLRDINSDLVDFVVWLYSLEAPHYLDLIDPVKAGDYLTERDTIRGISAGEAKSVLTKQKGE